MFTAVSTSRIVFAFAIALVMCSGCSPKPKKSDVGSATEAINAALTGWKSGKSPTEFTTESKIVVGDIQWESGAKLVDFQIDDMPHDDGRNFHFTTRLTVTTVAGETVQSQSKFIVATNPVVTVFRDDPILE